MFDTNIEAGDYFNLIVTHECNKKCPFCIDKMRGTKEYISLDSVRKVLKDERLKNQKDVLLIGGEPTLHPEITTIAKMVKDSGKKVILTTNYTKPEKVKELDGIVDSFNISFYNQKQLPNQRDFKSDLTLHALIHKRQLETKEKLDSFIDKHSELGMHFKFSTLQVCNEWTKNNQKVDYLNGLNSKWTVLFDELLGQIYREAVIKRYDLPLGTFKDVVYKIHTNGEVKENW